MTKIRTRFAPSPTGTPDSIHLGFVIRALWNYAFAKKNDGQFVLRIEDTDQKRSRKDTEEEIYSVLKKFGIQWDEGPDIGGPFAPYRQSERLGKYLAAAEILIEKGYAYYDFDAPVREKEEIKNSYNSSQKLKELKIRPKARSASLTDSKKRVEKGEPYVVRIKIPEERVFEYDDWILKKRVRFYGNEVSDLILLKSDGFPTYHLAVVVDDIDMQISHVFRGQEWISSTPIHLYIYEGLEHNVPTIGHFSVILDPRTGKKFSKRDMTSLFGVKTWLSKGYLPEAILNYLMLLGWAPKDNRETFTLEDFVQSFDQAGVQKANPTFDGKKLDWFNQQYIQKMSKPTFISYVSNASVYQNQPDFKRTVPGTATYMPTRISTIADYDSMTGALYIEPDVDKSLLGKSYAQHLSDALIAVEKTKSWDLDSINKNLMEVVQKKGYKTGDFFMDLRVAITGQKFTPPINDYIISLGRDKTLNRLKLILKD